jgi:hypothetical protein
VAFNFSPVPAKKLEWFGALAVMLTLFLFARPIFKDYFVRPNDMMYSFGGDALVLYYNTSYHARYGDGPMLHGMNFPDGEYIYLTDAQGALSNTLQWVNRHIADIRHSAVGFVNGLNLYLLFPAALFLFFLLRALGCSWAASVLFSPLVLLLSPQIIRMGGHFGLAYPFLIPLAMLWFLRKYRLGQLEKRDALVFATSLFFTFNNPYTGFNFNLFLVFAGFLTLLAHRFQRNWWKTASIVSGMGIAVLAVAFLDFKINDPVSDRVNPQWGFFDYHANIQGLFNPPGSILHGWLTRWGVNVTEMDFETLLNIGLMSTLALACILFMSLWSRFSRTQKTQLQRLSTEHRVLIGAAALMFIIAANTTVLPLSKEWIEQNLSWLLMFKASGRLAWPMYFALALTGVLWADRVAKKMPFKWLGLVFLLAAASLWNAEINQYMRPRFREVFHPNFFDKGARGGNAGHFAGQPHQYRRISGHAGFAQNDVVVRQNNVRRQFQGTVQQPPPLAGHGAADGERHALPHRYPARAGAHPTALQPFGRALDVAQVPERKRPPAPCRF